MHQKQSKALQKPQQKNPHRSAGFWEWREKLFVHSCFEFFTSLETSNLHSFDLKRSTSSWIDTFSCSSLRRLESTETLNSYIISFCNRFHDCFESWIYHLFSHVFRNIELIRDDCDECCFCHCVKQKKIKKCSIIIAVYKPFARDFWTLFSFSSRLSMKIIYNMWWGAYTSCVWANNPLIFFTNLEIFCLIVSGLWL